MKKTILLGALFILIGGGCSVNSNENPSISARLYEYKVQVVKSETNKNTIVLKDRKKTTMEELMKKPGIRFESSLNGIEKVTMLDGVIATASKQWNLYVDDKKVDFNKLSEVNIKEGQKIEWKYEAKF